MNLNQSTIKIAGASILGPLAVILQILPPIFISPWSMRIDLVAIPWMICWIIFGLKPALLSLFISAPLIGFLGPFAGGWVGATMKSIASIWMFLIPAIFAYKVGGTKKLLENKRFFIIAAGFALIARVVVTVFFNYYFALPFFFGMTQEAIINTFENSLSFFGHSLGLIGVGAFIGEVAFWNILQGIVDLTVSLILGILIFRRIPLLENQQKKN
ncbi:hypothetical protein KJN74_01775 [Candidatus Bathyarchaeota archaeon]|nr:hypothetical protein [Candidatus Bathyarchaeota archaeon]